MLEGYYKRFDPDKNYEKMLFRSGRGLQSAELNDLQEQLSNQVEKVSDTILANGDVLSGGDISININTGVTQIGKSSIYLRGYVRELDAQEIVIPTDEVLYIGVWLTEKIVSEVEDPDLRDPAADAHNYQEPGAGRLQIIHEWGLKSVDHSGTFYPVFRVENGVHIVKRPPPQLDAITVALARFDRESNGGSYVVNGMEVIGRDNQEDKQVISITEGQAHIEGFSVKFPVALRKTYPIDPDLQTIVSEPHSFEPDDEGNMRIDLSFSPINDISAVDTTVSATKTLVHGSYGGALDPIPDTSVLKIISVTQTDTEFTMGTDFKLTGNKVDWSLSGEEPAPGSSYTVTYHYRTQIDAQEVDENGFTINGVVPDSIVFVDYQWKMPRIDLITLDKEGVIRKLIGIANPYQPRAPKKPANQLSLAEIEQTWRENQPLQITNHAIRTVSMSELKSMQEQISDLYDLVTIERLRNDANAQDPAAKKGVFVDPFLDDDMRDQGEEQTAAIVDGELVLPIDVEVADLEGTNHIQTLEYELETILSQPMHTGSMPVNPYQAFEPIPPKVTLYPQVDRWTVTQARWSSPITRRFNIGGGGQSRTTISTSTQVTSRRTKEAEYLRERTVNFEIINFGPGEKLTEIVFDGLSISSL